MLYVEVISELNKLMQKNVLNNAVYEILLAAREDIRELWSKQMESITKEILDG